MGIIMKKISGNTIIYMMRIVGGIIMLAALGLITYLAWITSHVGLDGFLISGFGIGVISIVVASLMIYFSYRIAFEEEKEIESEVIHRKERASTLSRKCG